MAFTTDMILGEFEDAALLGGERSADPQAFWSAWRDRVRRAVALWREVPANAEKTRRYMREYRARPEVRNRTLALDPRKRGPKPKATIH